MLCVDAPWTPATVEAALVEAFRQALIKLPIVPVFAASGMLMTAGRPDTASRREAADVLSVLNWPTLYVPERRARTWLLYRVSNKARQRDGIAEFCREANLRRSTFDRACDRAITSISDGLNAAQRGS